MSDKSVFALFTTSALSLLIMIYIITVLTSTAYTHCIALVVLIGKERKGKVLVMERQGRWSGGDRG